MPEEENISIDEALQRGIAAHKATDLRQANLYYSAILKAQPHHPDANHNMGILAISIGKIDVSIGYFENAIKSNNKNEQYWLSLINAYSDLGNFQKALNTIASVRKIISPSENFDFIEQTVLQQQAIKRKKDLKHEEKIPQELVDQLIDFYNSKKFNETVQKASLLLKSYPKSDALWNILGGAYNFLGKFDMALACYEQATLLKPNLPDNYFNIAVILNEKGNIDDAIVQYKQVLKIDPLYFKAHLNIGNIFQLKGDLLNAIKSYEAVLKINPEYIQAYFNLAEALKKSGKTQLAINAYNTVIEKDPNACYAFHNLGALYLDSGDLEKSIENCIKTIDCNPAFAEAHFNLATGLQRIGKLDSAIKSLKQAIKLKPDYADAMNNLGNMYQLKGDPQEAIRCFEKSLEINPELAPARAGLGDCFVTLGRPEQALSIFNEGVKRFPNFLPLATGLANLQMFLGMTDKATSSFQKLVSMDAGNSYAHRQLSGLTTYHEKTKHFTEMERLYRGKNLGVNDRINFGFALGKAYDDIGEYAKAFSHFSSANSILLDMNLYDFNNDKNYFKKLKKSFRAISSWPAITHPELDITPIFIVGMPRSGTTLLEQILSAHDAVHGAGELPTLPLLIKSQNWSFSRNGLEIIRQRYYEELSIRSTGAKVVCDKLPHNFLFLPIIAKCFPNAKIVHITRDRNAVCWSNFRHYFPAPELGYSQCLKSAFQYYDLYAALMRYWEEVFQIDIIHTKYEALCAALEPEAKTLLQKLGLPWDRKCARPDLNSRFIQTASTNQVRSRVYTGSSDKWQNYIQYLQNFI